MSDYSAKALPYLCAIAQSVFTSQDVRDWLIEGTVVAAEYTGSKVLEFEQEAVRWAKGKTKQPFWSNYHCGRDSQCTCRVEGSRSLESDAIFFFQNAKSRVLAVHVEFKRPGESFLHGQPEGYPCRAKCFVETWRDRPTLNEHHDWTTVLFCGPETLLDARCSFFSRLIVHSDAAQKISGYPTTTSS